MFDYHAGRSRYIVSSEPLTVFTRTLNKILFGRPCRTHAQWKSIHGLQISFAYTTDKAPRSKVRGLPAHNRTHRTVACLQPTGQSSVPMPIATVEGTRARRIHRHARARLGKYQRSFVIISTRDVRSYNLYIDKH